MDENLYMKILDILENEAILVGSAARTAGKRFNDLDFVVSERTLKKIIKMLPKNSWTSCLIWHIKTYAYILPEQLELMVVWYGPMVSQLKKSRRLTDVCIEGRMFKAWPIDTRQADWKNQLRRRSV